MTVTAREKLSILIVEDDEFMATVLSHQLTSIGYRQVSVASSGGMAISRVRQTPRPEVLLCDLSMPGMDGVELMRQLRDENFTGGIVIISGVDSAILKSVSALVREHGLQLLGAVQKPVSIDRLEALLDGSAIVRTATGEEHRVATNKQVNADDLRQALERKTIEVHYQPKLRVEEGRVCGVEALARWEHEEFGQISPDVFIPLAEKSGLSQQLGAEVFQQSLRQAGEWRRQGRDWSLAVNVCVESLLSSALPDQLSFMAEQSAFPLARMILDIPVQFMHKPVWEQQGDLPSSRFAQLLETLNRLRLKGPRLAIDGDRVSFADFLHLSKVPFSEFKLDRNLVHAMRGDAHAVEVASAAIALARSFDLEVVAEGVEEQEDWDNVGLLQCEQVQGGWVAPPMRASELDAWFAVRGSSDNWQ